SPASRRRPRGNRRAAAVVLVAVPAVRDRSPSSTAEAAGLSAPAGGAVLDARGAPLAEGVRAVRGSQRGRRAPPNVTRYASKVMRGVFWEKPLPGMLPECNSGPVKRADSGTPEDRGTD